MNHHLLRAGLIALLATGTTNAQTLDLYDPAAYRDIHLTFSQTNWWSLLVQNEGPEIDIPADLTIDGVNMPMVGVRFRGNTSSSQLPAGSEKKSFNIRIDSFVQGQDFLGYDHLNLNNGFHDPTFLREFLAYRVMRSYGPAPGCNFVRLFLNGTYWGVYINVQQPNKDMVGQWWRSNDGNRYRGFPTSGGFQNGRCALTWLGNNVNDYLSAYQAKEGDGTDLMMLCDILNNTPSASLPSVLPTIFSVDQFYRYAAVMNVMTQTDSYIGSGKDHFLYHDDVYGQFHMFPFDLNEALAGNPSLSPWFNTGNSNKPAFSRTIPVVPWRARYLAHYRTIAEEAMNWATLGATITQFHGMIANDVVADTKKIYTTQAFFDNVTIPVTIPGGGGGPFGGGTTTVPGLQPLITNRDSYLSGRPDLSVPRATLTALQHMPPAPTPAQGITITVNATSEAQTMSLWSRSAGPFTSAPMFDDGLHGDGAPNDGTWGAVLPAQASGTLIDYYVASATSAGTLTFLPKTAEHLSNTVFVGWPTASSPIKINEFLARNNTVIADPNGQFEDYLELVNTDSVSVDISGMFLTDDLTQVTKFQIPAGTVLPAGGRILIWCDEDGSQGPYHANFKLSASGEVVALFATDGMTQLDAFAFGPQYADISTGRFFDGGAPFVTFSSPTPGTPNELPCGDRSYSALDPALHDIVLTSGNTPTVGNLAIANIDNGPPASTATLYVGSVPAHNPVPGTTLTALIDDGTPYLSLAVPLDGAGAASYGFGIPNNPALAGLRFVLQAAAFDGTTWRASNGLDVVICP